MNVEYYNRYNTRISFQGNVEPGGLPDFQGAVSTVLSSNLAANRVVVSNTAGKIAASSITTTKLDYLNDVTGDLQAQIDAKEATLTKGNLTEATSSVLTITGGTAAIIGSGLTIQVQAAGAGQSGYLSTTDWNTFNNKLGTSLASARVFVGNGSNVATGVDVTGDIAMSNSGVVSISAGVIINADVHANAAIALSKLATVTASRVLGSDVSGFITALDTAIYPSLTELSYVKGASSSLQTQLGTKLTVNLTGAAQGDLILRNASEFVNLPIGTAGYVLTSDGTTASWGTPLANGIPTGGSADQYLSKINGTNFNTQWTTLTVSKLTDFSGTADDLDLLAGADAAGLTSAEIQRLIGVSSNIQTQIGSKLTNSLAQNAMWIGNASNQASSLAPGSDGYVLTIASGVPTWQAVVGTGTVTSIDVDGGTTGLTFSGGPVSTTGTITMAGTLVAVNGGTGVSTVTTGDLLYGSAANTWSKLAGVAIGSVLISGGVGTAPAWSGATLSLAPTSFTLSAATTVNISGSNAQMIFTGTSSQIRVQGIRAASTSAALQILGSSSSSTAGTAINLDTGTWAHTSGTRAHVLINTTFNPTSGTGIFNLVTSNPTVNQTGGANGLVTIFNSCPTITAAVDVTGYDWNPTTPANITGAHLAYRATSGKVLFGGTTITAGSVLVDLQSTSTALLLTRVTNIASVATPVNGMVTYDAATNLFNFRQNGAWINPGTIGGSTGATDNRLLRSDGTGGLTLQNSVVTVDDNGDMTLGTTGTRILASGGTLLSLQSNAGANILNVGGGAVTFGISGFGTVWTLQNHALTFNDAGADAVISITNNSSATGNDLILRASGVTGGNADAGHVYINSGAPSGSGISGNIGLLTETGSFGGGGKVIFIANATTVPASNPTGGGILYVEAGALKYRGSSGTVSTIGPA